MLTFERKHNCRNRFENDLDMLTYNYSGLYNLFSTVYSKSQRNQTDFVTEGAFDLSLIT